MASQQRRRRVGGYVLTTPVPQPPPKKKEPEEVEVSGDVEPPKEQSLRSVIVKSVALFVGVAAALITLSVFASRY